MSQNERRKKWKEVSDSELLDRETRLRLNQLIIEEMEYEHELRREAIRLSQKREKHTDTWIF